MLSAEAISAWQEVLANIQRRTTTQQFATWFRNTQIQELTDEKIVVSVPSTFHRDWIATYYKETLETAVSEVFKGEHAVFLVVSPRSVTSSQLASRPQQHGSHPRSSTPPNAGAARKSARTSTHPGNATSGPKVAPSDPAAFPLLEEMDFDHFVVGPFNQLVKAAGMDLIDKNGSSDFKTLFVVGGTGLGKTHSLQAMASLAREKFPQRRVAYIRAESFVNDFMQAIQDGETASFRDRYRNLDFVCFDDLQVLTGKERTQQEFLHTLIAWQDRSGHVVLAARSVPGEPLDLDPQLQALLASAFKVNLRPPEPAARQEIVRRKAASRGEDLAEDVVQYLAELPASNIRELEGAVTSVIASSRLGGVPITLKNVRATLQHDSMAQRPVSSPERILNVVCSHFEVKLSDLVSGRRPQALSFARQVSMFLLRERTELSLSEIGSLLGGRDHTTILHGIRKIERAVDEDNRLRDHLARIRSILDH